VPYFAATVTRKYKYASAGGELSVLTAPAGACTHGGHKVTEIRHYNKKGDVTICHELVNIVTPGSRIPALREFSTLAHTHADTTLS